MVHRLGNQANSELTNRYSYTTVYAGAHNVDHPAHPDTVDYILTCIQPSEHNRAALLPYGLRRFSAVLKCHSACTPTQLYLKSMTQTATSTNSQETAG